MLNEGIRQAALERAAENMGCGPEDLTSSVSMVISPVPRKGGWQEDREYVLRAVTFGSNVVVCCEPSIADGLQKLMGRLRRPWELFEPAFRGRIEELLAGTGAHVEAESVSFLPDEDTMEHFLDPGACVVRVLENRELAELHRNQWPKALDPETTGLERLAVGAFDPDLVGLAVAAAESDGMWRIRVDVPDGRRHRLMAAILLHRLACEVLAKGKVPCLTATMDNPSDVRNALLGGLRPFQATLDASCGAA